MELGSEYSLDLSRLTDTSDTVFTYLKDFPAVYTDSGRSALRLLSGRLHGQTILLPDYICQTVPDALPHDCNVVYYPTDCRFQIDTQKLEALLRTHSAQFLYLMHYFGTLQPKECLDRITEFRKKYRLTVIEDTTHSLFSARLTAGDYGIASLRKWFPVPDGGVLYARDEKLLPRPPKEKKPASRKVEAMLLKQLYLTEGLDCNAKYREMFAKEEQSLDCQAKAYGMSDMAFFLLSHYPTKPMCRQRRENARQLLAGLCRPGYSAAVTVQPQYVPFTLPVYSAKRNRLREYLMHHNIYCAVHWPSGHPAAYEQTKWMESHILSLPIDQRYGRKEISYLLECLNAAGPDCLTPDTI